MVFQYFYNEANVYRSLEELFWYMQESLFPLLDVNKEGTVEIKFSALILHYDILSLLNLILLLV